VNVDELDRLATERHQGVVATSEDARRSAVEDLVIGATGGAAESSSSTVSRIA